MIGTHTVEVVPDPTVVPWSAPVNSNPNMTTDLAGWTVTPFQPLDSFVWAAPGVAKFNTGFPTLLRGSPMPVRNPDVTLYRVRVRATVNVTAAPGWLIIGMNYGVTEYAATTGPFWTGTDAIEHSQWFNLNPGVQTVDLTFVSDTRQVPPAYGYVGPFAKFYSPNTQVGWSFSIDSITLDAQVFDYIDVSCLIDAASIEHGRDNTTGQPDASTATLDLSYSSLADALPDGFDVGSLVRVSTVLAGTRYVRFSGYVTDLITGWDDAGEDTPTEVVAQIIAAGALAAAGRRIVGDEPWPVELDGARVTRVLGLAGYQLDPVTSDPGTVQILARDVDKQPALDLVHGVAESATGIVWETRTGAIRYADADHRRGVVASLSLDACDVLVTPTWRRDTAGLVNAVSIGYGVPVEEGGDQPTYFAERTDSAARFGRYEVSTSTELAALADAQAMASLLLTRNAFPVWLLSALPLAVADLDAAETAALLSLDMHDLLSLTGLPVTGALPGTTSLWVEGWSETLSHGVHELTLNVSGYCRTAPPPLWDDVQESWTWDAGPPPSMTWDLASCFGPPVSLGRWADVPASLRWDWVPIGTTWDTWKG